MLPKTLQHTPFTYSKAIDSGLTQRTLRKLLSAGVIERVERGVYRSTDAPNSSDDELHAATLLAGTPSAICLLSALSSYQLTDRIPKATWIMVESNVRRTSKLIRVYRAREPMWKIGIDNPSGYSITSLDRTIVDCLCLPKLLGTRTGLDALKLALNEKKTTPKRIIEMSARLNVQHRVLPYIEALT